MSSIPPGHYPCFFEPFHGFKSHFIWQHSLFLQLKSLISIIIRFNPQLLASSPLPQAFPKPSPSLPFLFRWGERPGPVRFHPTDPGGAARLGAGGQGTAAARRGSEPSEPLRLHSPAPWWQCRLDDWFGWTFAKRCYHHPMADVLVASWGRVEKMPNLLNLQVSPVTSCDILLNPSIFVDKIIHQRPSPLAWLRICAAANGYLSTMEELLLDERVDLEVSTRLGQTALFKAVPGTIWDHLGPSGTIWDHLGPSGNLEEFGGMKHPLFNQCLRNWNHPIFPGCQGNDG